MRFPRIGPEAFDGVELRLGGRVVVAFLADWCPFCRAFEPHLAELARSPGEDVLVADMTDPGTPLWERFAIETVPTVLVFQDGKTVLRADGVPGEGLGSAALRRISVAMRTRPIPAGPARPGPGRRPSPRHPRTSTPRRVPGTARAGPSSR